MAAEYRINLSKQSAKYIQSVDKPTRKRINDVLNELTLNPKSGPHIKPLKGPLKNQYRYQLSWIRIIYKIQDDILLVQVATIGPRGDVYK